MARDEAWDEAGGIQRPTGMALWGWWTAATIFGWVLAGIPIGAFMAVMEQREFLLLQYACLPLTALGQWLVLRRHFAQASRWLIATTAGWLTAGSIAALILNLPMEELGPPSSGLRVGLSTLFDGLALGIAQWLVLRGNVPGTHWWIPAAAVPLWLVATGEFERDIDPAPLIESLSAGELLLSAALYFGFLGLLIGVTTGGLLAWLVEQPRLDERE